MDNVIIAAFIKKDSDQITSKIHIVRIGTMFRNSSKILIDILTHMLVSNK